MKENVEQIRQKWMQNFGCNSTSLKLSRKNKNKRPDDRSTKLLYVSLSLDTSIPLFIMAGRIFTSHVCYSRYCWIQDDNVDDYGVSGRSITPTFLKWKYKGIFAIYAFHSLDFILRMHWFDGTRIPFCQRDNLRITFALPFFPLPLRRHPLTSKRYAKTAGIFLFSLSFDRFLHLIHEFFCS